MEFLVLEVDDARFGIPTSDVREVVPAVRLAAAPVRFPKMNGILNYRGHVLGVLALATLGNRPSREMTPNEHLIILESAEHLFALRVDLAVEIMTWVADDGNTDSAGTDQALNTIAHPRLGVVHLLDADVLWTEMHQTETPLTTGSPPKQEVEAL